MIMEGSSPMAIVLLPAMILVFLGTFGAAIAGAAMSDVSKIGNWFKLALMPPKVPPATENIAEPDTLGHLIAGAFVATLWGVMTANVFWLPMAAKITRTSDLQAASMELLVEGIAEIQAGTSPRAVRQKLASLVPPSEAAKEAA